MQPLLSLFYFIKLDHPSGEGKKRKTDSGKNQRKPLGCQHEGGILPQDGQAMYQTS